MPVWMTNAWNNFKATMRWLWTWGARLLALALLVPVVAFWCTDTARLGEISGLKAAMAAKDSQIETLNSVHRANAVRLTELETQLASLTDMGTDAGRLRQEKVNLEWTLRMQESRLVELTNEKSALRASLEARITQLSDEARVSSDTIAALYRQRTGVIAEVNSFRERLKSQDEALTFIQEENANLAAQLATHQQIRCSEQIAALNSQVVCLTQENRRLRLENARLTSGQPAPSNRPVDVGIYTYGVTNGLTFQLQYWPAELTNGTDAEGFPRPPENNRHWPKQTPSFQTNNANSGDSCHTINDLHSGEYMVEFSQFQAGVWVRRGTNSIAVVSGCNVSTVSSPSGSGQRTYTLRTNNGHIIMRGRGWSIVEGNPDALRAAAQ